MAEMPYDESRFVGRNVDYFGEREVYERETIGEMTTVVFEDRDVKTPALVDEYLKQYYADYLVLPELDKRNPKHIEEVYWKD